MIEELFKTDNPETQADLERINSIICSDIFLKGLGVNAHDAPSPAGFPVVSNVVEADELLNPKKLYELPEPWPYHELFGAIEHVIGLLEFGPGVSEERTRQLLRPTHGKLDPFGEALLRRINEVFERDHVVEHFLTVGKGAKLGDRAFKNYMEFVLPVNLHAHLYYIVQAAYLVGLSNSPLFRRMLEAFETGGIPCGWIGQSYEEDGDPYESVALLHFGRQSPE